MRNEKQRNGNKNSLLQVEIIHHLSWIELFANKERGIRLKTEKIFKKLWNRNKSEKIKTGTSTQISRFVMYFSFFIVFIYKKLNS